MPTNCKITFDDNADRVYYGGQTVSGSVQLQLAKEKTVRGIFIEFLGKAYCHWTEGSGNKKETHTGTETYLEERIYFVGQRTGELTLPPGVYNYRFRVSLPIGLPTSLEAQNGHIRYGLQVVLDRPRWSDQKFEESFTVIKPLNLNTDLSLRHPVVKEETKRFNPCCVFCCCASDPLFIAATVPVSGYTPGQTINVDLELTNNSNENISAFVIQIIREVKFHTYENSSTHIIERDAIAEIETRGCYSQQKQAYIVDILVPPTPPSDSTASKIVCVSYSLIIEGMTGCFHINPVITMPITIGSYPILDQPPNYTSSVITLPPLPNSNSNPMPPQSQPQHHQPAAPSALDSNKTENHEPSAPYPEHDPPSYEQAIGANQQSNGERKFVPNYPVYRRETSYSSSQNNTPVLRRHCNS